MKRQLLFIAALFLAAFSRAQVYDTVNVSAPGTLSSSFHKTTSTITNLTVTGKLDETDLQTLKYGMPSLSDLNLSGSRFDSNNLPDYAFSSNNSVIKYLTLPDTLYSIGSYAFSGCASLTEIILPQTLTSIGDYAFSFCTGLTSINIPTSVTSIGENAFQNCSSLQSIEIPSSVSIINVGVFYYCSSLTSVTLPNTISSIQSTAFSGCSSLNYISLPSDISSLGDSVFMGCTNLDSVNLLNVTSLGHWVFANCTSLKSVVLPSSLTTINTACFYGCSNLQCVKLPFSLQSIDLYNFENCSNLQDLYVYNDKPIAFSNSYSNYFSGIDYSKCSLHVPYASDSLYRNAPQWKNFTNIVKQNGGAMFQDSLNLESNSGANGKINVVANCNWEAFCSASWLKFNKYNGNGDDSIIATAEANATLSPREAIVVICFDNELQKELDLETLDSLYCAGYDLFYKKKQDKTVDQEKMKSLVNNLSIAYQVLVAYVNGEDKIDTINITRSYIVFVVYNLQVAINDMNGDYSTDPLICLKSIDHNVVVVSQSAFVPVVSAPKTTITFDETSLTDSIFLTSNTPWQASSDASWLTLSPASGTGNDTIIVTAGLNTGAQRTATITIVADSSDTQKAATFITITVTQQAATLTGLVYGDDRAPRLYPNPASNRLNILLPAGFGDASVSVFSIQGTRACSATLVGNSIDVSSLPAGTYILQVTGKTTTISQKFTKR